MSPLFFHPKDLSSFNTFQLPSYAERYVSIQQTDQLSEILQDIAANDFILILGGGSNLILDKMIVCPVIHMQNQGIVCLIDTPKSTTVRVGAGVIWHDFVHYTLSHGWYGLENLAWIPGTVGAAPVQNIGAYGVEVAQYIDSITIFDRNLGRTRELSPAECAFGYRHSIFKETNHIITEVTFQFQKDWLPRTSYPDLSKIFQNTVQIHPEQIAEAVIAIRQQKLPDPKIHGNAGSFFKNPVVNLQQLTALRNKYPDIPYYAYEDTFKLPAAWLIDTRGWKEKNYGGVRLHPQQALVLINSGDASFQDVVTFSKQIQEDILSHFGIHLEPEPLFVSMKNASREF